jgi:hypothetical protein
LRARDVYSLTNQSLRVPGQSRLGDKPNTKQ